MNSIQTESDSATPSWGSGAQMKKALRGFFRRRGMESHSLSDIQRKRLQAGHGRPPRHVDEGEGGGDDGVGLLSPYDQN